MIERITTIRNHHRIKAKLLISLYFTKVKWHLIPFIYTVVSNNENPKKQNEKVCFRNH